MLSRKNASSKQRANTSWTGFSCSLSFPGNRIRSIFGVALLPEPANDRLSLDKRPTSARMMAFPVHDIRL